MSRMPDPTRAYIDATFAPEDALLERVRAAGEALRPGLQLSAGEAKLLGLLAKLIGARRILEIGCFVGYSAIALARSLPEEGTLMTLELSPDYAALARRHFEAAGLPITLLEGDALSLLPRLEGSFDLVFIDADKRHYLHYLHASLPLLRSGGLIIGDNSLLFGAMIGAPEIKVSAEAVAAMRAFNEAMATHPLLEGILIPTRDGLTVAQKR